MEDISLLLESLQRPALYEPGAPLWTHPHIAGEMLKAHLSPDTDAASYRPETIRAICDHLTNVLRLRPGDRVTDLGCGPGLYCRRLADRGLAVTGIDLSEGSLDYARALCAGLPAQFRKASYLEPFGENFCRAVLMVSQDYGVLAPADRRTLLANVFQALERGGCFALDVSTLAALAQRQAEPALTWEAAENGFWRSHAFLALHAVYPYPQDAALCDLYAVLDGEQTVYRIWQTYFSEASLRRELTDAGFKVDAVWSDLAGSAWREDSTVLGMLCHKP